MTPCNEGSILWLVNLRKTLKFRELSKKARLKYARRGGAIKCAQRCLGVSGLVQQVFDALLPRFGHLLRPSLA